MSKFYCIHNHSWSQSSHNKCTKQEHSGDHSTFASPDDNSIIDRKVQQNARQIWPNLMGQVMWPPRNSCFCKWEPLDRDTGSVHKDLENYSQQDNGNTMSDVRGVTNISTLPQVRCHLQKQEFLVVEPVSFGVLAWSEWWLCHLLSMWPFLGSLLKSLHVLVYNGGDENTSF